VPPELVGLCFNCLASSHVRAKCTFPARCYNCWCEGQRASACSLPPRFAALAAMVGMRRACSRVDGGRRVSRRRSVGGRHRHGANSDNTASARSASMGRSMSVPRCCAPLTPRRRLCLRHNPNTPSPLRRLRRTLARRSHCAPPLSSFPAP